VIFISRIFLVNSEMVELKKLSTAVDNLVCNYFSVLSKI
jgi:hypothetical protein